MDKFDSQSIAASLVAHKLLKLSNSANSNWIKLDSKWLISRGTLYGNFNHHSKIYQKNIYI